MAESAKEHFVITEVDELIELVDDPATTQADLTAALDAGEHAGVCRRASIETLIHVAVQSVQPTIYVAHTHPTPVVSLLSSVQADTAFGQGAYSDEAVVIGKALFIPFSEPGLALGRLFLAQLRAHMDSAGGLPSLMLLGNHGIVAAAASAEAAEVITVMAVKGAQIRLNALAIGGVRGLAKPSHQRRTIVTPEQSTTSTQPRQGAKSVLRAFEDILGKRHVLASPRATAPYAKGNRYGAGSVLAVLRPATLLEMWHALRVCVDHDLIVIPQAANTGLTGGSGPGDQEYDRQIVILSTNRINQIHLVNEAREAVCLAGATLFELEDALAPHGREPHSVIGSSSIGASVIGGIANNSGGSQIRKGPAFTRQAIYARIDEHGQIQLINHLGIDLGGDPEETLRKLQSGDWSPSDVTSPPADTGETEYAEHVRQIVGTPARFNADPNFLFEASGSAGKLLVFAVRTRTFPKELDTATFYIGTNSPAELEQLRREILLADRPLPISGEYIGGGAFDLAAKYGKDTFVVLKHAGSRQQMRLFAFKTWANNFFARIPFVGRTFADTISQLTFGLLPSQLPPRMLDYRRQFEHHLIMSVSGSEKRATEEHLTAFFQTPDRRGAFFMCTPTEAKSGTLHRFGAASAATRFYNLNRRRVSDMITFDVALRRDDADWLEVLPSEIASQLELSSYYGHFFCHVLHQDHVAKKGVDPTLLKKQMMKLLEDRGAALPAEHNYGRIYDLPPEMEEHFKQLDPQNIFNPGLGGTSRRRGWS